MAKLIHYYKNVDMRNAHAGLLAICSKNKIDVSALKTGEFVLFVNRAQTVIKLLGPSGIIVHVKDSGRLDLRTIQHIPEQFGAGNGWSYQDALKKVVERDMAIRRAKKGG